MVARDERVSAGWSWQGILQAVFATVWKAVWKAVLNPDLKRTVFYVNPAAGSGKSLPAWQRLVDRHPSLAEARVIAEPRRPLALQELARLLTAGALDRILVVGGDGSFHVVANEVLKGGWGQAVNLGLIPAGTGSDLARTLGIPKKAEAALHRCLEGSPAPCDVLEVRTETGEIRYSTNVTSLGISGLVDQKVNSLARKGIAPYVTATLQAAARFQSVEGTVEVDGEPWFDGAIFLLAVANGRYFGRGMKIAPAAEIADGLLDLVLIRPFPRWQLPLRMPRVFLGSHLTMAPVSHRRGRRITVRTTGPLPPLDLDGESLDAHQVEISVVPGALRVLS
jgi:diacylglycerol kinase (ATP)